jgi:hypothetical protein
VQTPLYSFILQSALPLAYTSGMATVLPFRKRVPDVLVPPDEALAHLGYMRQTMERAASFTAVPGVGGMVMGGTALLAALSAHMSAGPRPWLAIWLAEAMLALAIALLFSYRKAADAGSGLLSKPFRRFVLAMMPPVGTGAVLTTVLFAESGTRLLPTVWLLLYGAGVCSAGAFSVRVVPAMGIAFLALGTAAAFTPGSWGDSWMAAGFGLLHLTFGFWIATKYGG